MDDTVAIKAAAATWRARQDGTQQPSGRTDNAGRWYPTPQERRACCDAVRPPSRTWPYSLYSHCCTVRHVAALYDLDERTLRQHLRDTTPATQPAQPKTIKVQLVYPTIINQAARYDALIDWQTSIDRLTTQLERTLAAQYPEAQVIVQPRITGSQPVRVTITPTSRAESQKVRYLVAQLLEQRDDWLTVV
jgi:hypothetical protein